MKKEVSEHLSRAFFENKKPKKPEKKSALFFILSGCGVLVLIFAIIWWGKVDQRPFLAQGQDLILEKNDGPYEIDFDFSKAPTKVKNLAIDLGGMDIHRYESLTFSIRIPDGATRQSNSVKVILVNNRKEAASLYISNINNSWKKITVPFSEFSGIHDWTSLVQLSFVLEEWNVLPKNGQLLVDQIGFSKKRIPTF